MTLAGADQKRDLFEFFEGVGSDQTPQHTRGSATQGMPYCFCKRNDDVGRPHLQAVPTHHIEAVSPV